LKQLLELRTLDPVVVAVQMVELESVLSLAEPAAVA
jgi:hypothetical protein